MNLSNRLALMNRSSGRGAARNGASSVSTVPTSFRPVAKSIIPRKLSAVGAKSPVEQQQAFSFLEQQLSEYENIRKQRGYVLRDVAVALTDFIGNSYNVYAGRDVLSPAHFQELHSQISEVLTSDATFRKFTDYQKQELYETAAVLGQLVVYGFNSAEASGDSRNMKSFQQTARNNLEQMLGVSIEKIHFTGKGLEIR